MFILDSAVSGFCDGGRGSARSGLSSFSDTFLSGLQFCQRIQDIRLAKHTVFAALSGSSPVRALRPAHVAASLHWGDLGWAW